jgi:hypothetical protein
MSHPSLSEKALFCFGVSIFALGGVVILRIAFAELGRTIRRRKHLVRLPGRVISVENERRYRAQSSSSSQQSSYWMYYFPVVVYTKPDGQMGRFRSELGELHQLRRRFDGTEIEPPPPSWADGQEVEVFYDPAGEIKPCLAVAWSLWFMGIGALVAGSLFLSVAVLMCIFGGPKIFAQ